MKSSLWFSILTPLFLAGLLLHGCDGSFQPECRSSSDCPSCDQGEVATCAPEALVCLCDSTGTGGQGGTGGVGGTGAGGSGGTGGDPMPRLNVQIFGVSTSFGTVTSDDGGINCGANCQQDYILNTEVVLTAAAAPGSEFTGWTGHPSCSANADGDETTIEMNEDKTCRANFDLITVPTPHTLSVTLTGTGTGTVTSDDATITCGSDCEANYPEDAEVVLTASAGSDSEFVGWSGDPMCDVKATGDETTLTLNTDVNCVAQFDELPVVRTMTVTKRGSSTGLVESDDANIDCGSSCEHAYPLGSQVVLTATPDAVAEFSGWFGDPACTANAVGAQTTVTLDDDVECLPVFNPSGGMHRTLTIILRGEGSGRVVSLSTNKIICEPGCGSPYVTGTFEKLQAMPDAGSELIDWSGDPVCAQNANQDDTEVTMSTHITCVATFGITPPPQQYPLSVAIVGSGTGMVTSTPPGISCPGDCAEDYDEAQAVTLTPAPAPGSEFAGWTGPADCVDGVVTVTAATQCTATFNITSSGDLTITVENLDTGHGRITSSPAGFECRFMGPTAMPSGCDVQVFNGVSSVLLDAEPLDGALWEGWIGCDRTVSNGTPIDSCEVDAGGSRTIGAIFVF